MICYCPNCAVPFDEMSERGRNALVCCNCGYQAMLENKVLWTLLSALFSCIALFVVLRMWQFDIRYPLIYQSDALSYDIYIKTIIDNGWYLTNRYIGMPYVMQSHDFPTTDMIFLMCIKLLTFFSGNVAVVANLAYLLTFPAIAAVSAFVLLKIGLNGPFSLAASLLYTFLPYHLMRQYHLNLCFYLMVPFAIYCCLQLFREPPPFYTKGSSGMKYDFRYLTVAVLLGVTSEYYAFYSCFLLLIAGVCAGLYHRKIAPLFSAMLLVFIVTVSFAATLIPVLTYQMTHGRNTSVAHRLASESDRYALKITQMLLPVRKHRIEAAAKETESYQMTSIPSSSESSFAALGVIGGIGFLSLIAILLNRRRETDNGTLFGQLSVLNIAAVLYGTVGGGASLFALFVSPALRAHARIGIFIAFMSFASLFMLVQKKLMSLPSFNRRRIILSLSLVFVFFGMWDQSTSAIVPNYAEIKVNYDSDADFVRRMETSLPADSMVFQLPYHPFPEMGKVYNLPDYELARPYLHSTRLRWSYGAINGRESSNWQKSVVAKPVDEYIQEIRKTGFRGIYIDRRGFEDSARDLEAKLKLLLRQEPLVSQSGLQSFFVL